MRRREEGPTCFLFGGFRVSLDFDVFNGEAGILGDGVPAPLCTTHAPLPARRHLHLCHLSHVLPRSNINFSTPTSIPICAPSEC